MPGDLRSDLRWRSELLATLRVKMANEGLLEVDTAQLQADPIPEPGISLFSTAWLRSAKENRQYFLIPSPEVGMKNLLIDGSGDIYQLGHCFRQEPWLSDWHGAEFLMLEWYRIGVDYHDNLVFTKKLLRSVAIDSLFVTEFTEKSMSELFAEILNLRLENYLSTCGLLALNRKFKLSCSTSDSDEILFHRLYLSLIEPELQAWPLVFVLDYPALVPTLSRRKDNAPLLVERWELYVNGVELANCCTEENRSQWLADYFHQSYQHGNLETRKDFHVLYQKLPYCSGVALGVDRLARILNPRATDRLWVRG